MDSGLMPFLVAQGLALLALGMHLWLAWSKRSSLALRFLLLGVGGLISIVWVVPYVFEAIYSPPVHPPVEAISIWVPGIWLLAPSFAVLATDLITHGSLPVWARRAAVVLSYSGIVIDASWWCLLISLFI